LLLAILALAAPSPIIKAPQESISIEFILPSDFSFKTDKLHPDPFTLDNGTKAAMKAQWPCRQQEINQLFQKYELGTKPSNPSSVTGSFAAGKLTVIVSNGGKSITFSEQVTTPASGTAPYLAIIGIGGVSIPIPARITQVTFDNDGMAAQQNSASPGTGLFFNLYSSSMSTGATAAWVWAVSCIIDALETTPSANIDPTRICVSGCSRNGKGAFIVSALDDRIALTIPQESRSGGAAC
jgi:hypothetical protein